MRTLMLYTQESETPMKVQYSFIRTGGGHMRVIAILLSRVLFTMCHKIICYML